LTGEGTQSLAGGLSSALLGAWVAINTLPIELATYVVEGFIGAVTSEESVERLKTSIGSALQQASEWWGRTLAEWADSIAVWLAETAERWGNVLTEFNWGSVAQSVVDGVGGPLLSGLRDLASQAADALRGMAQQGMEAIDANSPSKLWMPVGEAMPAGASVGFEKGLPGLRQTIAKSMEGLVPPANPASASAIGGWVTNNISLLQTNNLPQAPAGFDRQGLMNDIQQQTLNLLERVYTTES
jgi:hypothetical protein